MSCVVVELQSHPQRLNKLHSPNSPTYFLNKYLEHTNNYINKKKLTTIGLKHERQKTQTDKTLRQTNKNEQHKQIKH
jgi:hypothetical protein